uniref:hypothetical protein n=1 Tax=Salmonella enterica TaxID=28901 RepID=UPI0020C2F5D1
SAWVLLWGGKYANIYGDYLPRGLNKWGHVMWDARRLAQAGVEESIFEQWKHEGSAWKAEVIKDHYGWSPTDVLLNA